MVQIGRLGVVYDPRAERYERSHSNRDADGRYRTGRPGLAEDSAGPPRRKVSRPLRRGQPTSEAGPTTTAPPTVENVVQSDSTLNQTPDVGSTIERSDTVQTANFRQNSPLSRDPYIRTYRDGEVYTNADGLYWAPIRPDLDSMINRIDPSLYQDLSVIPGPYGLRYGPGFSYLNVLTVPTPRNPNGYESHYRTGVSTRTNGGQLYGRETVFGGGMRLGLHRALWRPCRR